MSKKIEKQIDQTIQKLYLSYVNDFVTVEWFAAYYNLSIEGAEKIIKIGRTLTNQGA